MLRTALEGKQPVLFSELHAALACCVFCGERRPLELADTWMCTKCKRKTLFDLFWSIELPSRRQERSKTA
jgi:hypothetical protein